MICFKIYILSQLLFPAYGSLWDKLPKECGRTRLDKQKVRIIDGDNAELGQFPWAVRIGKREKNSTFFFCGGSLINRYYVVSAAHCEDNGDIVRLGENYVETSNDCDRYGVCAPPHQDIKVKRYKFFNFQRHTLLNDISLLELEEPAEFNEFVQPICLPHAQNAHKDLISKTVFIAGWGVVNVQNFSSATQLMYIIAPIVDPLECDSMYTDHLTESQFCIGYPEGGRDSCGGDSGGPATMSMKVDGERRAYLIAVVSFGLSMCGRGVAVYTDVSFFANWILEHLEKS